MMVNVVSTTFGYSRRQDGFQVSEVTRLLWRLNWPCTFCSLFPLPSSFSFSWSSPMPGFSDLSICLSQALYTPIYFLLAMLRRTDTYLHTRTFEAFHQLAQHNQPLPIPTPSSTNPCIYSFLLRNLPLILPAPFVFIYRRCIYTIYPIKLVGISTASSENQTSSYMT